MKISTLILFIITIIYPTFSLALKPEKKYVTTPAQKGILYDSLSIKTKDGLKLSGWFIKSKDTKKSPTIIICGSDAGNMSYNLDYAIAINNYLKVSIVLFDYRGFGASDDFPIDTNILAYPEFITDINSTIDWVKVNLAIDTNEIILYGMSMGASLSLVTASKRNDIAGVIADSPYSNQNDIIEKLNKKNKNRIISKINSPLLEPIHNIHNIQNSAVVIIQGQNDKNITFNEISNLFNNCVVINKSLWIAPQCNHLQAPYLYPNIYFKIFAQLVKDINKE